MTSVRRVALCIDDFGLHVGVNAAVLDLAARGLVNAVGCMVGAPAWREGAPALARFDPAKTDIGLHLDFTEHPVDARVRLPLPQLILRAYARALDIDVLRREIGAQLDAFAAATGRAPDYVDGHQHVHQLPMIRDALVDALGQRGQRPWLRRTRRPRAEARHAKSWLIEALGADALTRLALAGGFAQNTHLLGVYGFDGDAQAHRRRMARWLAASADGDVLMCHASLDHPAPDDALLAARRTEHAQLTDPAFAAMLEREAIVLSPISRVFG